MSSTPTPWRLNRPADDILSSVRTENNQFVIALGTSHEDAELIVRVVNCHEELTDWVAFFLKRDNATLDNSDIYSITLLLARAKGET